MKKKYIIVFILILLLIGGYCGYQRIVEDANVIFPMNREEIAAVTVWEYKEVKPGSRTALSDASRETLLCAVNNLNPVWDGEKVQHYITRFDDYRVLYEVTVRYVTEKSKLRREPVSHIYFAEDGTIIADCGGFTLYQANSENYDGVLLLLETYAQECYAD